MKLMNRSAFAVATAVLAVAGCATSVSAATMFTNSGTTVDLTPANRAQTFNVGTADGGGYFYTFTTLGRYKLDFTDTGSLNGNTLTNPFTVSTGSTPGGGSTVATSTFGQFASGVSATLAAGTYTLYVPTTTNTQALSGTLSAGAAAVPEPASWAMMMVGFGAVGSLMRRRAGSAVAV